MTQRGENCSNILAQHKICCDSLQLLKIKIRFWFSTKSLGRKKADDVLFNFMTNFLGHHHMKHNLLDIDLSTNTFDLLFDLLSGIFGDTFFEG